MSKKPPPIRSKQSNTIDNDVKNMLSNVERKVVNAPVLNGGYDELVVKIEKIEFAQERVIDRVEQIHNAVFDPNEGIFAKISESRHEQIESKNDIEKQLVSLKEWRSTQEKLEEKEEKSDQRLTDRVEKHNIIINEISKWKKTVTSAGKWLLAALVGGLVTTGFKIAYEYIILHWR